MNILDKAPADFSLEEILHLQLLAADLMDALKAVGLQCRNTGMYGHMKIQPGQCECSTCRARKLLEKINEHAKQDPEVEPWVECDALGCKTRFHLKDSPSGLCPNCRDAQHGNQENQS